MARVLLAAIALQAMLALVPAGANANSTATPAGKFRVCADPNNLPFSNAKEQGFENKLAHLVAASFGENVEYTWWAQRRGFVRKTLKARTCDVIMGVPERLDMVTTTRPYYRSRYVFVSRADRHLDISAITDPRLRHLRIGVQLIGNDGFNTPPAHALGAQEIVNNVVGFPVYGDYRQPSPAALIITAVENGSIDVAAAWGPLAGYFAARSAARLQIKPIRDTKQFAPLRFEYDISMGVRKGDEALKARLNDFIVRHQGQIDALLASYNIPVVKQPAGDQILPAADH